MWKGEKVEERWEMGDGAERMDCWFVVLLKRPLDRKRARTESQDASGREGRVRVRDGAGRTINTSYLMLVTEY
jgi:hypothetical protein